MRSCDAIGGGRWVLRRIYASISLKRAAGEGKSVAERAATVLANRRSDEEDWAGERAQDYSWMGLWCSRDGLEPGRGVKYHSSSGVVSRLSVATLPDRT